MQSERAHVEGQLAGYALGALEARERRAVEEHLAKCASCSALLEQYRELSEALLCVPPAVEPGPGARAGLIAALGRSRRQEPRQAMRWSLRRVGMLGLGVAMLALIFLNVSLLQRTSSLRESIDVLTAKQQASEKALALAQVPSARRVAIEGDRASGTLLYDPSNTVAVAYLSGLEVLAPDVAYQAWLIAADGTRTSGGLLQPASGTDLAILIIQSPVPLNAFVAFGMTIEPSEGSPGPTGPKVVGADL